MAAMSCAVPGCRHLHAPHQARLDHRVAFPVAPLLLVIIFQRRKAHHQRAAIAKRPQTHIDAVDKAVDGLLIQRFDQPLP